MFKVALKVDIPFKALAYFSRSKRITKSILAFATTPSFANARFRFFDFFVRM